MKIKNKIKLVDILYRENYDVIHIYDSGEWAKTTTGTVYNDGISLNRAVYYDSTKKRCREIVEAAEATINGDNGAFYRLA